MLCWQTCCGVCRALLLVASFAAASSFAMFVPYFALGQLALFSIQVSCDASFDMFSYTSTQICISVAWHDLAG